MKKILNYYKSSKKAVKASFWFVICGVMQRGITSLTTPIFTRIMTTEEYGIFSIFNSWLEILTVICTFRICYGIYMKGLIKYENDRDNFTVSLLGLSNFLVLIFLIFYIIFRDFINNVIGLSTGIMFCMFVMILSNTWFSFWSARQRVDYEYKKLVFLTIIISILKPLFGIIAIKISKSNAAYSRIISLAIVEFFTYVWLYISQRKKSKKLFDKKYWTVALKFNILLVPHYLSQIILNHSDRIMIKNYCGYSDAGSYSLAYSLAMIMTLFNTAFLNTLTPWNYRQLRDKNYKKMQEVSNIAIVIIACINLFLILIAPEVLTVFSPKSYHGALNVIPPVTMGVYFTFLYGIFVNVEMYYDKNNYVMIASCIGAILNIVLNIIFIPVFGYISAAYTTLICYLVYCLMHLYYVLKIQKLFSINENIYNYKYIFIITVLFISIGFIFNLTYTLPVIRYGIVLIILLLSIINRKKLYSVFGRFLSIRKKKGENV